MRGFVNAHTHVYSGLAVLGMPAPVPAPRTFVEILESVWWRLDRALDEGSLRAAARLYVADALLHGTGVLFDHHESPNCIEGSLDVIADVCDELGIRALLCYGATERNGGREEARRGLAECRRFIETNRRRLVAGCVGLHACFTVSDDTIREAGGLCRELGCVLHVHVAEDAVDVEECRRRGYPGPLERLVALGALPPGSILAHGVRLDAAQVRAAAEAGCWIVQNPRSNRHNNVGYPRGACASRLVALGTDGFPSNMSEEFDVLREVAAVYREAPGPVNGRLRAGWTLAAERLGLGSPDADGDELEFALAPGGSLERLRIAGRPIVERGRLLTGDYEAICAESAEQARRLWARL